MSGRILVQNALGNSLIDFLHCNLVRAIGSVRLPSAAAASNFLMAVFSSDFAALLRALRTSAIRTRFLADLIFGKPNTSLWQNHPAEFPTVQNDILTGNFPKSKTFFTFSVQILYIVWQTAKPMAGTTRFCVGRRQILFQKRTDLALEARELWQESAERTSRLSGVKATKTRQEGYPVTRVDILDHRGEEALGKPQGSYFTIDLTTFWQRKADFFERAVRAVGTELKALLPVELRPGGGPGQRSHDAGRRWPPGHWTAC